MMKMKMLAIIGLMTLALAGCQNTSDKEAALEDQVAQLEQQVTSLEKENQELSSTVSDSANASETTVSENTASENTAPEKESSDDIDSLTKAVNEAVKKANNASPSGSNDSNQKKFFELKGALQEVDNRLERYEEKIESDYRQGNLSYEKARDAEIEIERLEEKIDNAEDRLENVFGYDD